MGAWSRAGTWKGSQWSWGLVGPSVLLTSHSLLVPPSTVSMTTMGGLPLTWYGTVTGVGCLLDLLS